MQHDHTALLLVESARSVFVESFYQNPRKFVQPHSTKRLGSVTRTNTGTRRGLEDNAAICTDETEALLASSPPLRDATTAFLGTLETNLDGLEDSNRDVITLDADAALTLEAACVAADGVFVDIQKQLFECDPEPSMTGDSIILDSIYVEVDNMASCQANTTACVGYDPTSLLVAAWQSKGIDCVLESAEVFADDVSNNGDDLVGDDDEGDGDNESADDDDLDAVGEILLTVDDPLSTETPGTDTRTDTSTSKPLQWVYFVVGAVVCGMGIGKLLDARQHSLQQRAHSPKSHFELSPLSHKRTPQYPPDYELSPLGLQTHYGRPIV